MTALADVAEQLAEVSPAWAAVTTEPTTDAAFAGVARLGDDRARGFESIREGWLLHRGASRVASSASPDLALLIGDWCYAAGLVTITEHGTLDDVAVLADLIADVAARHDEPIDTLDPRWSDTVAALSN